MRLKSPKRSGRDARWVDVWSAQGQLLYSNKPGSLKENEMPAGCNGDYFYTTIIAQKMGAIRTLCAPYKIGGLPSILRVTRSLESAKKNLNSLLLIVIFALPLTIIVSSVGGYGLARRTLSPVGKMVNRAKMITADRLADRLPVENPDDELGSLASTFNDAFARLERSFEQMRRFTADASHELRTPLTALRTVGEVYLRRQYGDKMESETVSSMLEEVERMQRLIESLLTLSRADADQIKKNTKPQNLSDLVGDVVRHLEVLADEKRQTLQIKTEDKVIATVDSPILRQAIVNLVDNAIKYSPESATIEVRLLRKNGKAVIEVKGGVGISEEHLSRIFDRFYRVDTSRASEFGGFGLGLSIAKWAVEMNDGKIEVESREHLGSIFTIVLPVSESTTYS